MNCLQVIFEIKTTEHLDFKSWIDNNRLQYQNVYQSSHEFRLLEIGLF
ncbi:hypothetical protein CHISP_1022 [Chitinispirillum alkaliphilum]|nr:hypothetical protein CHISP_1022 [Chitinispirillum alkaliphilum]